MVLLGTALLKAIAYPFLAIAALDLLLKAARGGGGGGGGDASARWYLIHAVTNAVICALIAPDILALIRSPLAGLSADYTSDVPLAISVSLHLYHCASQAHKLTAVDWAHHLGGNMLVCALAFPFRYGPLLSWGILFVCGLPGGLDYACLFLVKCGIMTRLQEKRINRQLNMWVRLPGIVSFLPLSYVCWSTGACYVPWPILCVQSLLNLVNGVYFADRVVANAAVVEFKLIMEAKKREEAR
jgi:hypothetical protein